MNNFYSSDISLGKDEIEEKLKWKEIKSTLGTTTLVCVRPSKKDKS